jgi:hypothetical protein
MAGVVWRTVRRGDFIQPDPLVWRALRGALGCQRRCGARGGRRVLVSYADVWAFWQRNAALADEVDVVGVHILPY